MVRNKAPSSRNPEKSEEIRFRYTLPLLASNRHCLSRHCRCERRKSAFQATAAPRNESVESTAVPYSSRLNSRLNGRLALRFDRRSESRNRQRRRNCSEILSPTRHLSPCSLTCFPPDALPSSQLISGR